MNLSKPKKSNKPYLLICLLLLAVISGGYLYHKKDKLVVAIYSALEETLVPNQVKFTPKPPLPVWPVDASSYYGRNIMVYDTVNEWALLRKDVDSSVPIASLTKIMTTILAIEHLEDLRASVKIDGAVLSNLWAKNASMAGFASGETVKYLDLLYATVLPSGGEAATILANEVSVRKGDFIKLMNQKAHELKMTNTVFTNPTGLDSSTQVSSARDMVSLLRYALRSPIFRQIFTTREYVTTPTPQHPNGIKMHSTVLSRISESEQQDFKILGGKSGTTYGAGLCWAVLAEVEGREFIVVTLGAPLDNLANPTLYQKRDVLSLAGTIVEIDK